MLSLTQFEVLVYLEANQHTRITQRDIAKATRFSLGTINSVLRDLIDEGYLETITSYHYKVSASGYEVLEPHKIKRAIFLAAGFGSRLVPVTLDLPKPLIEVNGVRIIDSLLDAVIANGVEDIVIVRGYLKNTFDVLLEKYPMIRFIDNDAYNEANNISSAYHVKDLLANALVLESDLLLYDPSIIRKYEYSSLYFSTPVNVTDDWCFITDGNIITEVAIGGTDVQQMIGISYWNEADSAQMSVDIQHVYEMPGGKERYWDEVSLKDCAKHYEIQFKECDRSAIIEIDTFGELCEIDATYKNYQARK